MESPSTKKSEYESRESKAQLFLNENFFSQTLSFDKVSIQECFPKNLSKNDFDYVEAYQDSFLTLSTHFNLIPDNIRIIRLDKTEYFNKLSELFLISNNLKKEKGDWIKGRCIRNNILLMDYSVLDSDTSIREERGDDQEIWRKNYKQIITHELSHLYTFELAKNNMSAVPIWLNEALAINLAQQTRQMNNQENLKQALNAFGDRVPSDPEISAHTTGKRPIIYSFADHFTNFLFNKSQLEPLNNEQIHKLVTVVGNIGEGSSFINSFKSSFQLDFDEAYRLFLKKLNQP